MASLDWLVKVNDFLEQVPDSILKYFKALSKSGEELTQTYVDTVCRWLAWKVNIMVERKRQQVINTLYNQYGGYLTLFAGVDVVKQALNPLKAGGFFSKFAAPIGAIISFLKTLMTEIPRLAANLANIANALPPEPPNPHINFNEFKLRIGTVSFGEVVRGTAGTPTPEEMFPEPTKPWTKAAFNESFEEAKSAAADEGVVYRLPEGTSKISGGTESDGTVIV
jgi:hypothetical protein